MAAHSLPTLFAALILLAQAAAPAVAAGDNPSGLPLPRFASTRSTPVNVRVGPGERYDLAWVYVKAGTPVEIIQEFDVWRKIRDVDGSEGWVHQNLLSGKRAGVIAPEATGDELALHASADSGAPVRAYLAPGYRVEIVGCDGEWCQVGATDAGSGPRPTTYWGYLAQDALWGVFKGEKFD